ncbi:hypothetical protein V5N11_031152 [Cardamine amara subsp. amara]|uniref:CWF21 domain-containing protein n=1 Tax=Cardamine amara subsp. amara TaxID=228776 RepID=A0ABD1A181_CARAN
MYNGIGLQTARGSGTNGYVQTNKFFVRPRNGGKPVTGGRGFEDDQGTAGLSKKPNKDILEHDRKRQIHLKLVILEDKLADQGYSDAEIAQKLEEARVNLEAASASDESDSLGDSKISDTQTHQVAARKEKQMEAFRVALGLPDQQVAEEGLIDDEPVEEAYEGRLKERREHSFLDRDSGRKRDEDVDEKDGKVKESKKQRGDDDVDEVKRNKKKESKKRRHGDSSDESDEPGRDRRRRSKKKAKGRKQESESDSSSSDSESESDSDSDDGKKRRRKATKKRSRSKRSVSSESEDSDDSKKIRKSHKKSRPSNRSGSKEVRDKRDEQKRAERKRHDSDVSEPESEDNKQPLHKKEEGGGRKQKRDEEDVESNRTRDRYRGDSSGKKAANDSDDSEAEAEYENKKQLRSKVEVYSRGISQKRDEEEAVSKHGKDIYRSDSRGKKVARDSDDSESEYEKKRQLKDEENYQRGRKQKREEDVDSHGRDRYRGDDEDGYNKHKMDRYRGRDNEEEDTDKGDEDRDRYRSRRETVKDDEEDYKHRRDRYRGDKEDRFRGGDARRATGKEDEDVERVSREREYSNKGRSRYDDGRSSGKRSSYGDRA